MNYIRKTGIELHIYIIIAIGIIAFITTPANGVTINVPGDTTNIQSGIDAASDGDIVLIAPGIYNENLQLSGKTITLASWFYTTAREEYIEQTVIDGGGGTVIDVRNVGENTKIIGLTIQNGNDGISPHSKISILNNHIIGNRDGIDYESGSGGICSGNLLAKNRDDGIDLDGSVEIIITNNIIRDNRDDGIEIRLQSYSGVTLHIEIYENLISGNQEDGIQLIDYPNISDRIFYIERNVFVGNAMAAIGFMEDAISNEDLRGAPVPERVYLVNNTFVTENYGVVGGANVIVLNNIFKDIQNSALRRVRGDSIAAYNLLWNNGTDYEETVIDLESTLFNDPLLDVNYHLMLNSPAIDAGTATFIWQGETVLDMSESSYNGPAPDIGAFETLQTDCIDNDNDGYGNPANSLCIFPAFDCDDRPDGEDNIPWTADDGVNIHPGAPDICENGIDENCSGTVDEGCACAEGATRSCGSNTGECVAGTETCVGGVWSGVCEGQIGPTIEVCDNLDNDCDGNIDENLIRQTTCGAGECTATGVETCSAGMWGGDTCTPGTPIVEICDGLDNNCDGNIDEVFDADNDGYTTCSGDCNDGDPNINPDACDIKHDSIDQDCDGLDRRRGKACPGDPEICDDGIDNDLDRKIDCADKKDCRKDPAC